MGPCAKARVQCLIMGGGFTVGGTNDCANPQPVCPRKPGEDYTKCKKICQQGGHAEAVAAQSMKDNKLFGGVAILRGHYYACDNCIEALKSVGVTEIVLATTEEEYNRVKQANQSTTTVKG